jgi:hypothetical protein
VSIKAVDSSYRAMMFPVLGTRDEAALPIDLRVVQYDLCTFEVDSDDCLKSASARTELIKAVGEHSYELPISRPAQR